MSHVVIVGAGISGLSIAYRLQQKMPQVEITVLEESNRIGGTVWTQEQDGFRVEAGPNGFLDTKPTTLQLAEEVGLGEQLIPATESAAKNRYLLIDDKLKLLPNSFGSFLGSKLLTWRGKISLLWERFRRNAYTGEDESIDEFTRRRAGKEAAEVLADAMVTGIYAGDPKLLSMSACFPRLVNLEKEFGSVMKGMAKSAKQRRLDAKARGEEYRRPGKLWSFRDGLGLLINKVSEKLSKAPVTGVSVSRIMPSALDDESRWAIITQDNRIWHGDAVVLACPAYKQSEILEALDGKLARRVGDIPYNRVVVIGLGYNRSDIPMSVDGFGFIAPQTTRRDLLGVQWCSSIYPGRAPDDKVLLRAICGGWHRAEIVDWDDERIVEAMQKELHIAMGITAEPVFTKIVRWGRAIPQYHLGHEKRVSEIEKQRERFPGLFLGGNAYRGVALNDCTEQAGFIAEEVAGFLGNA